MSVSPGGGAQNRFDSHVHSEWSWDARQGSMLRTCQMATQAGLSGLAFTEHADHLPGVEASTLDVDGYLDSIERCRARYPKLLILKGVELGEPHRFPEESAALLASADFDLVLGSVHRVENEHRLDDLSGLDHEGWGDPQRTVESYLDEVTQLLAGPVEFQVLTHLEYFKRYWPRRWPKYRSTDHEDQIRALLQTAVSCGVVLELNTSAGMAREQGLCPGPEVLSWWREAGGTRVTIGSDAHSPEQLGAGLAQAADLATGLGLKVVWGRVVSPRRSRPAARAMVARAAADMVNTSPTTEEQRR